MPLLFAQSPEMRPDGLWIMDDNLVPHATAGLLSAKVRGPEDVAVLAHANFPYPTTSLTPADRLGFDAREVLYACVDLVLRQRRGEPVPPARDVPARFANELTAPDVTALLNNRRGTTPKNAP